jgi:Rrf2 family protein
MRLSTTDIYALQALGYLGTKPTDQWVGSDAISQHTGVARPYLVRILATLCNKGIIHSKKGTGGGYALAQAAEAINLKDVMRAIDGPIASLSCVSLLWGEDCVEQQRCHAHSAIWLRLRDVLLEALEQVSVADLAKDFEQGVRYEHCLDHLLKAN